MGPSSRNFVFRYEKNFHQKVYRQNNFHSKNLGLPPVGLELTTFELEIQHASPLRHGGFICAFAHMKLFLR